MKPIERLREEHEAIKLILRILERICERLEAKEEVNPQHLEQILTFIKIFADKCHHGKEEDVLFPAMERAGIPREGGPIGVMLTEHDVGREYVKGMSEAIGSYKAGECKVSSEIVKNARSYIKLLTEHIEKENNVLYPMAEMHLSKEEEEKLLEEFERIEHERIGVGKHEELHELLHKLKKAYLKE